MDRTPLHLLWILWLLLLGSSRCSSLHSVLQEGREVIHANRGPDGLAWVVQLTDLHFSSYRPDRASSFEALIGPLLALISPSLVLITGDLTDAKSKDLTSRRQDENEWIQYGHVINKVISESGLPGYAFYDMRGNHDKFGVPKVGGDLDYFSKYSVSSMRNRTSTVQSITLKSSKWNHLFVGIDTSMSVGLKGPCNLFGHPTEEQLAKIDMELSQWDTSEFVNVTKVVFGHFPMSFTASTEGGSRLECLFTKHSIAAYVCGHLHKSFGPDLIKHYLYNKDQKRNSHKCRGIADVRDGEFWEWELGDWRKSRIFRIITLDQGHASFEDFDISFLNASNSQNNDWLPTFIVPTYPLDSQRMERLAELSDSVLIQNDIVRALVFSHQPLVAVTAKFYDMISGKPVLLEELDMYSTERIANMGYIYEAKWASIKYKDSSGKRYAFQISAVNSAGKVTKSSLRQFSAQRRMAELRKKLKEVLVMDIVWEEAFLVLVVFAFAFLFILLMLPKFFLHFWLGNGLYQRWSYNLFLLADQKLTLRRSIKMLAWFFLQGCVNNVLWLEQLTVLILLMFFPWFWGQVLADGHSLGFMSLRGWEVRVNENSPALTGLGWPDLMVIVVPYLYFVMLPMYVLIFSLSAEASMHEIHQMETRTGLKKKEMIEEESELKNLLSCEGGDKCQKQDDTPYERKGVSKPRHTGCRWVRLLIIGGFLIISFIHMGQVCAVAGAHGYMSVLASPGFSWPVPLLMLSAVIQLSSCRHRTL